MHLPCKPRTAVLVGLLAVVLLVWYALRVKQQRERQVYFPDPEAQTQRLIAPPGFTVSLFAAEPVVTHPVAMAVDEANRLYVCETYAYIPTGPMPDEQIACRTFEQADLLRRQKPTAYPHPTGKSERLRLLEDRTGSGRAGHAETVADGFDLGEGLAAGVLARDGQVWLGNVPKLWLLEGGQRRPLLHGFGARRGYLGHDLHGLIFGPDGKLYFSMGDRGLHVRTQEGKLIDLPDTGSVLRCNPDGSQLEVFAVGLRNPQELAFDHYGNLFTADNNTNYGDASRCVQVVEGGDSGWRVGFDSMPFSNPWLTERLWDPAASVPSRTPPVAVLGQAPSGLAYYPGVGLPARYDGHFLLCDFAAQVVSFSIRPRGAGFELGEVQSFLGPMSPTDVAFGTDGSVFVSDWGFGFPLKHQGRIFRVRHAEAAAEPLVEQTRKLLAEGMARRSHDELGPLLGHRDQRVRQAAQFALAGRGAAGAAVLTRELSRDRPQLPRIHALWGLGQQVAGSADSLAPVLALLDDPDDEVRAQAARVLGDNRHAKAYEALLARLKDTSARVRYFAALGLGKLGRTAALPAVVELLRETGDRDAMLRHAGVMALAGFGDVTALTRFSKDESPAVRLGVLLALRRLERPEIAVFLDDADPGLLLEAVRAIHDLPITAALPALAALPARPRLPEPVYARLVNANFRIGDAEAAGRLATLAASSAAPAPLRVAALDALGSWHEGLDKDRVLGLWRPLPPRDRRLAAEALRPLLATVFANGTPAVVLAAARAARALELGDVTGELLTLTKNPAAQDRLRAEALMALAGLSPTALRSALPLALTDQSLVVRAQAVRLLPTAGLPDTVAQLRPFAAPESAALLRQAAVVALGNTADPAAETLLADLIDEALRGQAPAALELDLLEAAERKPGLRALARRLRAGRPNDPLAAWWECLEGGDAVRGRDLFVRQGCMQCHQLAGGGALVGPPLEGVGSRQSRRALLEAIVLPNAVIAAGYQQVRVLLRDGSTVGGRVLEESDQTLTLRLPDGQTRQLKKQDIDERFAAPSPMPFDFAEQMNRSQLRDLVEFLAQLKELPKTKDTSP
ncbi:MAG: HEAT repeat domain-containing protein [Planctomycetia bacterium]|nr:HEAT repeat domain-containing protein [Planctomycetia bacterium]